MTDIKDDSNLSQQDITWGSTLDIQFHPAVRKAPTIKDWQIRKSKTDFQDWIKSQARNSLFFDGAAKGNPGKAGAGGVVVNPFGEKIHSYAWGLGYSSSIQAEALALFQGLKILKELSINEANVIGDSQIVINAMVSNSLVLDLNLSRLITRIKGLENTFQNLKYYHVLRTHNKEADIEANKATHLSAGIKMKDEKNHGNPFLKLFATMFYCLLLNKFVCISKWGKITEIESLSSFSRKKSVSFSCILILSSEMHQGKETTDVIRFSAFRPR